MKKKFVIFLNGEYKYSQEFMDRLVSEETICFCADGGANFAFQYGKVPEMIIGDLDSIEKKVLEYYKSKNVLIKKFPKDKDFTDFELILKEINKISENEEIFYAEKSFALKNKKDFEFSIVPISENVEKLTLKGFKFETDGIDVKRESSRLVSNVICENEASIEFESGKLIVILKNKNLFIKKFWRF